MHLAALVRCFVIACLVLSYSEKTFSDFDTHDWLLFRQPLPSRRCKITCTGFSFLR